MSQHLEALARAQDFRLRRAQLKQEIKSGETKVSDLLRQEIPRWLEGMQIAQLIECIRYMPKKTIDRMIYGASLSHIRPLRHVTTRQRLLLAQELEKWEAKRPSGRRARPHVKSVASVGRAAA